MVFRLTLAILAGRSRSFRADALACVAALRPPLRVLGREHVPTDGPCLVVVNHFARPGFQAWWIPLAISAVIPVEVHWAMTEAWTFPNRPLARRILQPASRWILRRIARAYAFTAMPPMPPDPADLEARAAAVRRVLSYVEALPQAIIGLAPEGRDMPGGVLGQPPAGAGRFMLHLARLGLAAVPVGAYEADGALCLSIGPRFRLEAPPGLATEARDRMTSGLVMSHIAAQLPASLRGEFLWPHHPRA